MPDRLSQGEIDGMLSKPSRPAPEEGGGKAKGDSAPVVLYDFKHPSRVSKDQTRTLENLHTHLARMMASSFSTIQRSVVDCDIAFVDQTTYAEFIVALANPSCSFSFAIEPLGGPAIIDFAPVLTYSFIDRQFGGSRNRASAAAEAVPLRAPERTAPDPDERRPLTAIERAVMGKVATRMLADLEATWEALLKIRVSDAELETNPEFIQVAAPSDTVILIAFEVSSRHGSGLVYLCYPYFTLEPVMAYLNVQTWASRERGRRESQREDRAAQLARVSTRIRAVLAQGSLRLEDLLQLREGDVFVLDANVKHPAVVFVGDRPKLLARPGRRGNKLALQVERAIPRAEERKYMTRLQRTKTGEL